MMYEIRTISTDKVVYRTTDRNNALHWLEENNNPICFKLVRIK